MAFIYPFILLFYFVYSFALTDPNIIFSNHPFFISFQNQMWSLGNSHRELSTIIYISLIILLFTSYLFLIKQINQNKISKRAINTSLVISIIILIFSNPALSHDIYNYIFNARMVVVHRSNPHVLTAWDFPTDQWTRFVQNAHSPAPYGYVWTGLSIIPYVLGLGRLKLTILAFKVFVGAFFAILIFMQKKIQPILNIKDKNLIYLFTLNPLVLIETFSNGHNDVVMMALLFSAIYLWYISYKSKKYLLLLVGVMIFGLSISIKFASIAFLGGLSLWILLKKLKIKKSFGFANILAHFSPLLTARSQRFLPWYLIWSMSFLPLTKEKAIKNILVVFSLSSLLSYAPSLFYPVFDLGAYENTIKIQKIIITFSIPIVYSIFQAIYSKTSQKNR